MYTQTFVGYKLFPAIFLLAVIGAVPTFAQTTVSGRLIDAEVEMEMPGVNVVATLLAPDSTEVGTATDLNGSFSLRLQPGTYNLRASFVGYHAIDQRLEVGNDPVDLGTLRMYADVYALDEAVVEATQDRVVLRGDTTVFNADAFAVNPDATAEDLISKMPGVVVQDGRVQAQGEDVRRVLIDGEEFFGDDATASLRNLPSEIIQEVEVFDRQSDQARFTGFDDGETEKTINIVTRPGMQTGQFGRVYGAVGPDERYNVGGAINIFSGSRRITLIGLSNNVNQQNFSTDDLMGVLSESGGRGGRGGGPGGGGMRGRGGPGGFGGFGAAGDYLIGERGGLNTTNSFGVNYTDRYGDNVRLNASYFFNRTDNSTDARLDREYLLADGASQLYGETADASGANMNHRLNARLEATLSESTELTIRPRIRAQSSKSESVRGSLSALAVGVPLSQTESFFLSNDDGYNVSTDVQLRHRFGTRGRTISANIGVSLNESTNHNDQDVVYRFFNDSVLADSVDAFSRIIDADDRGHSYSARLAYTEPVGENGRLQLDYRPSYSTSRADQSGYRMDPITGDYTIPDERYMGLSERFTVIHRGGVSYRHNLEWVSASVGVDVQHEDLQYDQEGPRTFNIERSYLTVLPTANLRFTLGTGSRLDIFYRPFTRTPSASQLRDVVDDSNPQILSSGNPHLSPTTSHNINVRYRHTNAEAGSSFMGFFNLSTATDHIANALTIAGRDTLQVRDVLVEPGAQFSYPVNLDGYWSARSFVNYGRPVSFLRSNLNASVGGSYTVTPSIVNEVSHETQSLQLNGRLFLGSNISERVDFSVSSGVTYTNLNSSRENQRDNNSVRYTAGVRVNVLPVPWLNLTSNLNLNHRTGMSGGVDPTTAIWNAGLGYKFLNNNRAELRLTLNDILNQNTSIDRMVTDLYVQDSQTQALGRHVMLNLIYQLRHFGGRR